MLCRILLHKIANNSDLVANPSKADLTAGYIFAPLAFLILLFYYLKYVILKDISKKTHLIARIYKWLYFIDEK
jgi:hypothetical protein